MMPFFRHYPMMGRARLLVCAWLLVCAGTARADDPPLPAPFIPADAKSVRVDLLAARGFYLGGCYVESFECDEEVLAFDLHNAEALVGEARIRRALLKRSRAAEWRHLYLPSLYGPTYRKLRGIILPKVDFRDTPLLDAIEFLRRETLRLDTDPNAATRGVNVILPPIPALPAAPTPAPTPPLYSNLDASTGEPIPGLPTPVPGEPSGPMFSNNTPIILQLDRTSLLEAWRYVAAQAGRRLSVREDGLHLRWNTTDCGVPPRVTFHLALGRTLPSDLRPWLEARGVTFAPFTTVACLPHAHQLVVCGPWDGVDNVAAFLGRHADALR